MIIMVGGGGGNVFVTMKSKSTSKYTLEFSKNKYYQVLSTPAIHIRHVQKSQKFSDPYNNKLKGCIFGWKSP